MAITLIDNASLVKSSGLAAKQIEYIESQLRASHNRRQKTLRQQCKMFDQWLVELDKIKQSFEDK